MTIVKKPYNSTQKLELFVAQSLCSIIDSDRSRLVSELLKKGDFDAYLGLTIDPNDYDDPSKFADDYLVTKVLSKSPNLPSSYDRRKEAVLTFEKSEVDCRLTNEKFWRIPESQHPVFFYEMQQFIGKVLPSLNKKVLDKVSRGFSHGPGSTTNVRGTGNSVVEKYEQRIELTTSLIPFYRAIVGETWANAHYFEKDVVNGSKLTTVPKTAKTDRCICVEPVLNIYVQKGIGKYIRNRLRKFGLDLDIQAEKNRDAAQRAYSDELATIDLKAASDSISRVMVHRLLPPDWVELLEVARSPTTKVNGKRVYLEKISSMGNGYTFELESLIFLALCKSVIPARHHKDIYVFGDDLIFPRQYVSVVIEALTYLGFNVNFDKSFLAGAFFESCGRDYFKGVPVRPFFLKGIKRESGIPYEVSIANKLRLYAKLRGGCFCDSRFKPLWDELVRCAPRFWRTCIVPEKLGDTGILGSYDELLHRKPQMHGLEGYFVRTVSATARKRKYSSYGLLLHLLSGSTSPELATYGKLPIRGYLGRVRTRWTLVLEWSDGLDWS